MALLAEELVEEWLNRQGYFTIRGARIGVDEIDLLGIRLGNDAAVDCRHIEVQASVRPISYISSVPRAEQRKGVRANSARIRSDALLRRGVAEWVEKKFTKPRKRALMTELFRSQWTSELVVNNVKHEGELRYIEDHGVVIHRLSDILAEMRSPANVLTSAAGSDFYDLIGLAGKPAELACRE